MDIIEQIKERLSVFMNLYDALRVVDPIKKKTIIVKADNIDAEELKGACYSFWKKEEFCENCISMRAYTENDTFVKIENSEGKIFMLIATPLKLDGDRYIVEMLKDISQNGEILTKRNTNDGNFVDVVLNKMNKKIIKDELTGIYNKKYIIERLPVDINNSIRKQYPLSVIMADIDFFKKVNDNYGQLIGDKILMDFAKTIELNIRKNTDWVGRYDGEKFLIVLNNTDIDNAYKISEKIRKIFENLTFKYDDLNIKITSSFGVNLLTNNNIQELILNADKNLCKAKSNGRNKTVVAY